MNSAFVNSAFAIFEHACTVIVLTYALCVAAGLVSTSVSFGPPKE